MNKKKYLGVTQPCISVQIFHLKTKIHEPGRITPKFYLYLYRFLQAH